MDEFYKKMLSKKALNKLKWRDIGNVVSKAESTIRTAFDRRSLSPLEIRELSVYYGLDIDFSHHDTKIEQYFKEEPADYIAGAVEDIIAAKVEKRLQKKLDYISHQLDKIIDLNSKK